MKNLLKLAVSTGFLVSTSFIASNAVAGCPAAVACVNNLSPTSDCKGPLNVTQNDVTINLRGYTVCDTLGDAITVTGLRAVIKNGFVENSNWSGLWFLESGTTVENVTVSGGSAFPAIDAGGFTGVSIGTKIKNSNVYLNASTGVRVTTGDKNFSMSFSAVRFNGGSGIQTRSGRGMISNNDVDWNLGDGIKIFRHRNAKTNKVFFNTVLNNFGTDLVEENACGRNIWAANGMGATKNKWCVQ